MATTTITLPNGTTTSIYGWTQTVKTIVMRAPDLYAHVEVPQRHELLIQHVTAVAPHAERPDLAVLSIEVINELAWAGSLALVGRDGPEVCRMCGVPVFVPGGAFLRVRVSGGDDDDHIVRASKHERAVEGIDEVVVLLTGLVRKPVR